MYAFDRHKPIDFFLRMNIQSEIEFFSDLGSSIRLASSRALICEIAENQSRQRRRSDAVVTIRNEMSQRLARFTTSFGEDAARPRRCRDPHVLGARADKNAQRIMQNAYRRVLTSFESFDTTVLLNPH